MEAVPSYATASVIRAVDHTDFLFIPRHTPVAGALRVNIEADAIRPRSPQKEAKIKEALRLAALFHPNHVVSVRLQRARPHTWARQGRRFFDFRLAS